MFNIIEKFYNVFSNTHSHNADETDYIINEIEQFLTSKKRADMFTGEKYFVGNHDILQRKRMAIGDKGDLEEVTNLPNNKIVSNQYAKLVVQKTNYLLGRPYTITADNKKYNDSLNRIFGPGFHRTVKTIGEDALNCGIGWLFIRYDENGELQFKRIRPTELIPGWRDAEHTILDFAIRIYPVLTYNGVSEEEEFRVEVYDKSGVHYFEFDGSLTPCEPYHESYFTLTVDGESSAYNWSKIPLIPFKYNSHEVPLINKVKSLQDGLNLMLSDLENNLQEDVRSTILVLHEYDGENLGEFRRNLSTYGAVKVRSTGDAKGGVSTLKIEVNPENYKLIIELLKKAIVENGMGFDAKDDRMSNDPNQMNIQSMYSDIDLDANGMETEFQVAMQQVFWFVNAHLANTGQGDFEDEPVKVIFNRDVLINEAEKINNIRASEGLVSRETLLARHPYVEDVQKELERIKKEESVEMDKFGYADFEPNRKGGGYDNLEHTKSGADA